MAMADKSPQKPPAKKAARTLKQKRMAKREKREASARIPRA